MEFNRCFGCMEETKCYPCPRCGYDPSAPADNFVLPRGTLLNGRYVVGKVLGQGGFGITYIGFDLNLERKVAIKEFYPRGLASRFTTMGSSLQWASDASTQELRSSGMESFLREARKMAKTENIPEVVGVSESFLANNTAYIVMDYIQGRTLLSVLKEKGPMTWEQARDIFLPAISAMERVHREGLVHRDLSPDNLMLTGGGVRILDLGAAKDLNLNSGASSAQVAKGGFSPLEQYTQRGGSGPWSDVYAMAATMYYTLTGVLPPNAIDRMEEDTLDWTLLTKRGVPASVISALKKAMAVTAKSRTQSMAALLDQLQSKVLLKPVKPPIVNLDTTEDDKKTEVKKSVDFGGIWSKYKRAIVIGAFAAVILLGGTLGFATGMQKKPVNSGVHVMAAAEKDLWQVNFYEGMNRHFWGQTAYKRADVKTVTFRGSLDGVPDSAWDVSEAGDRSVLAWMEEGNLFVAADGKIAPNPNASWMFAYFVNVKAIDFGGCFDTSNVTDMSSMFFECRSLVELDVSGFDTSCVTNMNAMFSDSSLKSLDASNWDTKSVIDMGVMFSECSSLAELNISGFDTSRVINMNAMFSDCSSLRSLDVSRFRTSNVTDMSLMFSNCSNLTQLDVSGFDTSNVTDMSWMFSSCSSLQSLDLSNWNADRANNMYYMFSSCDQLTDFRCTDSKIRAQYDSSRGVTNEASGDLDVDYGGDSGTDPGDWDASSGGYSGTDSADWGASSGGGYGDGGSSDDPPAVSPPPADPPGPTYPPAESDRSSQVHVMAATENLSKVNKKDRASEFFWGQSRYKRSAVKKIVFRSSLKDAPYSAWDVSEAGDRSILAWMEGSRLTVAANGNISPNANASWMFAHFENVTSIDFGNCFDTSRVCNMYGMFYGCSNLTSLDLSDFDTSNVTSMPFMFYGCSSLRSLDISGWIVKKADMTGMFRDCDKLTDFRCTDRNIRALYDSSR